MCSHPWSLSETTSFQVDTCVKKNSDGLEREKGTLGVTAYMQSSRTTDASLLPAPQPTYICARRTRRKNNVRMAAPQPPKPSSGYAAALQPPLPAQTPAGASQPADPNKRQRVYEPFQPPAPAAPRDATGAAAPRASPVAMSGAASSQPVQPVQPVADKLGTIAQAVQALQEEQATTTLRYMQMQSQLTDKEAKLADIQAQLHEAKKNLQAATSERDNLFTDNCKLRATLKDMMDKEASKKELTDKLKINMRQTAECMVALGYATQPVVEASAELVFSPGASLSSQATPMSHASQEGQSAQE